MSPRARAVLTAAVVFAVVMAALEYGGWWWAWLAGIAFLTARRGVRLPLFGGVRLSAANRYILRENRKVRRHARQVARQRRREQRARRSRRQQG